MKRSTVLFFGIGVILFLGLPQVTASRFPTPLRFTSAASGEEMFAVYCSGCHGWQARGGSAPELTTLAKRNGGKFPAETVREIIRGEGRVKAHGPKEMPAWGMVFRYVGSGSDLEVSLRVSNLAEYIRSIQEK